MYNNYTCRVTHQSSTLNILMRISIYPLRNSDKEFANGTGDQGSIPGQVIPNTQNGT